MDRVALVFYLENVRDLDVVKYKIKQLWNGEKKKYKNDLYQHPTVAQEPELRESYVGDLIFYSIILAILIVFDIKAIKRFSSIQYTPGSGLIDSLGSEISKYLSMGLILGFSLTSLVLVVHILKIVGQISEDNSNNKLLQAQYKDDLIKAKNNQTYHINRTKEWEKTNSFYETEYAKADQLLASFYSMNIIPLQYRNLSAVCYLYEYMSSCQESFQMALISNQIEDGIKRIEAKLDMIVDKIDTVIWEQKVIREENRRSIEQQKIQNNRMIDSLINIERSQQNIEEYSRLSANYNATQAFISTAYYLKHC